MFCAQLNGDGIVVCVSDLPEEITEPGTVLLAEYDVSLLGMRYKDGRFTTVKEER